MSLRSHSRFSHTYVRRLLTTMGLIGRHLSHHQIASLSFAIPTISTHRFNRRYVPSSRSTPLPSIYQPIAGLSRSSHIPFISINLIAGQPLRLIASLSSPTVQGHFLHPCTVILGKYQAFIGNQVRLVKHRFFLPLRFLILFFFR